MDFELILVKWPRGGVNRLNRGLGLQETKSYLRVLRLNLIIPVKLSSSMIERTSY